MDTFQKKLGSLEAQPKLSQSNKKRKWREIEQLKEQHQLQKELKALNNPLEYMYDDF